jgi:hypothetical protein
MLTGTVGKLEMKRLADDLISEGAPESRCERARSPDRARPPSREQVARMLKGIAVWGNLGDRDRGELAVAASHRSYDCREVIVGPEAAHDSVFAIVSGEVSVRRVSADGKEIVLRLLEPGEVFGAVSDEAGIEPKSSFGGEGED